MPCQSHKPGDECEDVCARSCYAMKDDMSANNEAARARAAAYAGWFLYGADVQALLPRIDAAITRIVNGQGCMRIPSVNDQQEKRDE
jgi:hypothetical protein